MKLIYFAYFLLKSDYKNVFKSIRYLKGRYSSLKLSMDSIGCSIKYGTSLDDYFSFRFYEKKASERFNFASTLYMYKFHKALNEKQYVTEVDNKIKFSSHFKKYTNTTKVFNDNEEGMSSLISWIESNKIDNFVIKDPIGTVGKAVWFASYIRKNKEFTIDSSTYGVEELFNKFSFSNQVYIEPYLKQHSAINKLAPTAVNTIRVITVLRKDGVVDLISAAFRISVNSNTDNFSTGNLAAAVDLVTGKVVSPGIKRMAACSPVYDFHPVTKERILGFQLPYWERVLEMVQHAAHIIPQVRTVGWDIAILDEKPIIIEGNPGWNKGAPQIPLNKGIKPLLYKYLGKNGV